MFSKPATSTHNFKNMNRNPQPATRNPLCNALTIDVEDYFMVSAFTDVVNLKTGTDLKAASKLIHTK